MKREGQEALAEIHDGVQAAKAAALIENVHPVAQGAVIPTGATPTLPALNGAFSINLEGQTMGDYMDYQEAVSTGIFKNMIARYTILIKKWPYGGDPSKPEDYRALTPKQFKELSEAVSNAMGASFQESA